MWYPWDFVLKYGPRQLYKKLSGKVKTGQWVDGKLNNEGIKGLRIMSG